MLSLLWVPAGSSAGAQVACDGALGDPGVSTITDLLDRAAATDPVWDEYSLAEAPVVLALDTARFRGSAATPACTLIWRSGASAAILELSASPALSTPLYGFLDLVPRDPAAASAPAAAAAPQRLSPEDQARLSSAGVTRAVVLPAPLHLDQLGSLGEMLKRANVDPALIQAELAVHEGFHLHVQFPAWFQQPSRHAWPGWDIQPDRRQMREACYAGSPEIAAAFSLEVEALLAAFDARYRSGAAPDTAAAREAARRFIELRGARYTLLDTVTVPQGDRRIGCPLAETHLELAEGTAQWVGHATLVLAGIRQMERLRGSYGAPQPDAFYRTGPLQLWLLDGLFGREATYRLTAALARSPGPELNLFSEFTRRIQ